MESAAKWALATVAIVFIIVAGVVYLLINYPTPTITVEGKVLSFNFTSHTYSIQLKNGTIMPFIDYDKNNLVIGQTYLLQIEYYYQDWPKGNYWAVISDREIKP
jgi:hypothetical protein